MNARALEVIGSNGTTVPRRRRDWSLVPPPPRETLATQISEAAAPLVRSTLKRERAIARLRAIQHYKAGWDGEHGAAPRPRAVSDAMTLLANLTRDFSFSAAPEPDGAVELSIRTPAGRAALVFEGDGKVVVFVRREGADYVYTELQVPRRIGADRELIDTLQSFADSP